VAEEIVANPGSTLGEAIGTLVEVEVNRLLRPIAEENGCVYITVGPPNRQTGKPTKLLLKDTTGNQFQIDSVIANADMQPLVLIESKYIRYTKHNRDKGSWICTAHYSLRRTFSTVRKSVAILVDNWSAPSKALMESFDVSLFEVSFSKIATTLSEYGVNILWGEKERDKAILAWEKWTQLNEAQYDEIGHKLLSDIEPNLRESMKITLDTTAPRQINEVELMIATNVGESKQYTFNSIESVIEFLAGFDEREFLDDENGPSLWTPSPTSVLETPSLFPDLEDANNGMENGEENA